MLKLVQKSSTLKLSSCNGCESIKQAYRNDINTKNNIPQTHASGGCDGGGDDDGVSLLLVEVLGIQSLNW